MVHLPTQLLLQVMDNRACRPNRCRHIGAAKAVERFYPKMLAQGEPRMVRQESEIVVRKSPFDFSELRALAFADQQLGGRNSREIVHQRADIARLRNPKF